MSIPALVLDRLRRGIVDNSLHYRTELQAALWNAVARCHSPAHNNPAFTATFQSACATVPPLLPPGPVHLIGLGSGTGAKEAALARAIGPARCTCHFVDVSSDLLDAGARAAHEAGAAAGQRIRADLRDPALPGLLATIGPGHRLITFLGLLPTLPEEAARPLLRTLVRPDDVLLLNAHLAPGGTIDPILGQYDNPETRRWIAQFPADQGIPVDPGEVDFEIIKDAAGWTLQAVLTLPTEAALPEFGITWPPGRRIVLFQSRRHIPDGVAALLRDCGLAACSRHTTPCGQEGWWIARRL